MSGDGNSEEDLKDGGFRWVIHGTFVIPTANPFSCSSSSSSSSIVPSEQQQQQHDVEWLGPGLKLCHNHVLTVSQEDGTIVSICHESKFDVTPYIRTDIYIPLGRYEFLCPGFIDLHIHAPQFAYTGTATDRPLMGPTGWLETYTFPAESSLQQQQHNYNNNNKNNDDMAKARRVYERVVQRTLASGTTTACYFATLHLDPCKILADTTLRLGQRALVGKVCMDRESPDNYVQSTQQNIDETQALIDYIQDRAGKLEDDCDDDDDDDDDSDNKQASDNKQTSKLPLLLPIITPRFIPTCTPELLTGLGRLATDYKCHIQSHISESIDQVAYTAALEGPEKSDAELFDSHALLTNRCIMAHGVHLSESDSTLMRTRGAAVAHCPLSNFFFAGAIAPCRAWMEGACTTNDNGGDGNGSICRNKVGLGTDVAGGYSPSMMESARMAVVASRAYDQQQQQQQQQKAMMTDKDSTASSSSSSSILDYRHAFYLATLAGAEALGVAHKIGTIAQGMELDAIIMSASSGDNIHIFDDTDTTADIFQKIMNLGDDRNVKRVFVQGREVMKDGKSVLRKE